MTYVTSVVFLPDHVWQPWACQIHGFIGRSPMGENGYDPTYECCPDCTEDFIQMGERRADHDAEEDAQERRKLMRRQA